MRDILRFFLFSTFFLLIGFYISAQNVGVKAKTTPIIIVTPTNAVKHLPSAVTKSSTAKSIAIPDTKKVNANTNNSLFIHKPVNDGSVDYQTAKEEWVLNYPNEYEAWVKSNTKSIIKTDKTELIIKTKDKRDPISNPNTLKKHE